MFFKKRILPIKNRKTEHHHWILHIRISLCTNFQLKLTILIVRTKFIQKRCFQSKKTKSERNHGILHIRIRLNFSLNWQFWIFGTNLPKKGNSNRKQNEQSNKLQAFAFGVVNVNSTIVFEHFEDLKNLIILNILKEKSVISCLLARFTRQKVPPLYQFLPCNFYKRKTYPKKLSDLSFSSFATLV